MYKMVLRIKHSSNLLKCKLNLCIHWSSVTEIRGGGTLPISPINFIDFLEATKHYLLLIYHVYIWQMSPQLSCGDTCQISTWSQGPNIGPCIKSVKDIYKEINQQNFSNPHPRDAGRDNLVIGNPSQGGWKANRLVALRADNPATWLLKIITEDGILWTPRHRKDCQPFHWSQSRDLMAGLENLLEKLVTYLAT